MRSFLGADNGLPEMSRLWGVDDVCHLKTLMELVLTSVGVENQLFSLRLKKYIFAYLHDNS